MSMKEYVSSYVKRAKAAQQQIQFYSQEQIDEVCVAIGWEVYNDQNIEILAKLAVEETKMGNVGDKITKHKNKVLGVLKDVQHAKSVGCIEVDEEKKIRKYAKPVGVVGALTPVTNPTATPASNGITILKGRNAVISHRIRNPKKLRHGGSVYERWTSQGKRSGRSHSSH
jgi:sulfoacetaldehyde dehydrogenase